MRRTKVKFIYAGHGGKKLRKKHLSHNPYYSDMKMIVLMCLSKHNDWTPCYVINKSIRTITGYDLKTRQVARLVRALRVRGYKILSKRTTNPYENPRRKGILGKRSIHSTYPNRLNYYKLMD